MKPTKSVFLIEDDKDDQEFFIEAVSQIRGISLYAVANNGKEALDRLKNAAVLPDFIFSDIQMPGMDGIECMKAMKTNRRTKNIPYIILSSSVVHSEIVCSLGAKAFLEKPSSCKLLREKIELMIGRGFVPNALLPHSSFLPVNTAA